MNLRYMLQKSWGHFLRYGTPDPLFGANLIFFIFFLKLAKNVNQMIVLIFWCVYFVYNSMKAQNMYVNPVKISKIYFFHEILLIILLDDGNVQILWYETSTCLFLHFLGTSKNATFFIFFLKLAKNVNQMIVLIFWCVYFVYNSMKAQNMYVNPVKISKIYFFHEILLIILLDDGNVQILWYETSTCLFLHFLGTSKNATSTQYFNYKLALFGQKEGNIGHKKFQRFQKWC